MDYGKKNIVVNRIITGTFYLKVHSIPYKIEPPTKNDLALASMIYEETIDKNKYSLPTKEKVKYILRREGTWNEEKEKHLKDMNEYIDNLKIQLYKALYNKKEQKSLRKKIKNAENAVEKALLKKHSLDGSSLEGHAQKVRDDFLIAVSIKDIHGNPVYSYENYFSKDNTILESFLNKMYKNFVSTAEYREIARTEPFRTLWAINKERCFAMEAYAMGNEQKTLLLYSKMYDNVYENQEKPTEEVINDDYMLDGWFALQRKEAEKDRKQREVDKLLEKKGVAGKGGDLFVITKDKGEAKNIRDLNNLDGKMKLKQRQNFVKEGSRVEENQLPDVKLDLKQEAMRQMSERFKRK